MADEQNLQNRTPQRAGVANPGDCVNFGRPVFILFVAAAGVVNPIMLVLTSWNQQIWTMLVSRR